MTTMTERPLIEIVTFTGVDDHTDIGALAALYQQYPRAEFGVLVGRGVGGIFPPMGVVDALHPEVSTAIHLCGPWARAAVGQEYAAPYCYVHDICAGFQRVQINLHGDIWRLGDIEATAAAIHAFAMETPCDSVIVQHRGAWEDVPLPQPIAHPKVEYLWDRSEGAGMESFDQWPAPPKADLTVRWGYAGGMGPRNMDKAIAFAEAHPQSRLWFEAHGGAWRAASARSTAGLGQSMWKPSGR